MGMIYSLNHLLYGKKWTS